MMSEKVEERHGSRSDEETVVGYHEHADKHEENGGVSHDDEEPIDPAVEKRLLKKLDIYLTPLISWLFLLSFLDRSNIGNARIAGLDKDLGLSSPQYEWLLTIFYIAYIIGQPQSFMWKIVKPHYWAFFVTFTWGVVSTCQAATTNWSGMMGCRFILGFCEAGFGPGIPFLLSFFYKKRELGLRCGMFFSSAALASTFAGAIAYGLMNAKSSVAAWRLLFIVEGVPSAVFAFLAFYLIPDGPDKARYLTAEESAVARRRAKQQRGSSGADIKSALDFKDIGKTLLDYKSWFTPLMYFSMNVSYSSLPVFLPTILTQLGFSPLNAQGLSAPPYFIAFGVCLLTTWLADKTGQRGLFIAGLSCLGGVGYIMLAVSKSTGVRYAGVYLAAAGVFPAIGNVLPWVVNNQGSDSGRGAGVVILNIVGQCGPLLGTRVYPESDAPLFVTGQSVSAAFLFFNAFLALSYRFVLKRENKKLDEKYGPVDEKSELEGQENYGKNFRYVL